MNFHKTTHSYTVFLTSLFLPLLFCHSNSALEKVTFLGVSSSTLAENMSEQLNLPKGVHLAVEQVSANSPAADSGLKLHDVLLQLDDQILVNSAQLKALVQMKESGDIITLKILRKGKPKTLKVTLSEIERQLPRSGNHYSNLGDLDVFSGNQFPNDFEHIFPHLDSSILNLLKKHGFSQIPNGPNSRIKNKRFFDFENPIHGSREGDSQSHSYSSEQKNIIMSDENGTVEFSEKDGHKWLKVKDSEGNIIHDGPVNTEQQIQELPNSIREKLQKMDLSF